MERMPTGIEALDRLIEGGVPKATSGIIVTDRKSPGSFFGQLILWNKLQSGLRCSYFHTRYASDREFLDEMTGNGWNAVAFVENGVFQIHDYLALAELTKNEEESKDLEGDRREVEGKPISAEKLTRVTSQATYDFALYEDLDLLLRRIGKSQFADWAETVAKLQKNRGGIALAVVYRENLPSDIASLIDRLGSDCTIELRTDETPDGVLQHHFRVTRMKGTHIARHGWVAYLKAKDGISAA